MHPRSSWPALLAIAITLHVSAADPPPAAITVPATLEAFEQTDMYAKVTGYLSAVNADIGQHVKAGDVLAVINDPELEMDLREAKAMLNARQRLLDASAAALKQSQMALAVANHQLERYKADAAFQDLTLKRQQELFTGKAITDQQLDEARNKAAVASADVGVAEAKVAAAEADIAGAEANRAVADAQVQVAAAQIAKIETLLQYTRLTAPYEGTVTRRTVNRGDLVQASASARSGLPLFTVQNAEPIRVFCDVPESQAGQITVGTAASVKLYGQGSEPAITAKVTRMAGAITPETRTLRVEIDIPNAEKKLLPGSYAQVTLTPSGAAATTSTK
jgi:multidrug resistance efflux pump